MVCSFGRGGRTTCGWQGADGGPRLVETLYADADADATARACSAAPTSAWSLDK